MIEERFSSGDSFLHRADARTKLVVAAALSLALALGRSFPVAGAGVVLGAAAVLWAGLDLRHVLRRLAVVNGFVLFLWIMLPLSYGGDVVAELGPLAVRADGLAFALLITLKSNGIVLLLMALLATSTMPELGRGLDGLGLPRKLSILLLFTYRYVFLLGQEYQRLARSARMRCFRPTTSLHCYRTYAYMLAMVLVRAWGRAQRVRQAMALRGFDGSFRLLQPPAPGRADRLLLAGGLAAAVGLAALHMAVPGWRGAL